MLLLSKSLSSPQSKLLTHSTEDVGVETLALEKELAKNELFFFFFLINTFNDSEWHCAKTLMPSEALQADCLEKSRGLTLLCQGISHLKGSGVGGVGLSRFIELRPASPVASNLHQRLIFLG